MWNAGCDAAADELLAPGFAFRGSTTPVPVTGRAAFRRYRDGIRGVLQPYTSTVLDTIVEGPCCFLRVTFRGTHVGGPFLGHAASGCDVEWVDAARFECFRSEAGCGWATCGYSVTSRHCKRSSAPTTPPPVRRHLRAEQRVLRPPVTRPPVLVPRPGLEKRRQLQEGSKASPHGDTARRA